MKYLLGLLGGLVAGVLTAAAILFFNPLTRGQNFPSGEADWVLDFAVNPAAGWLTTHDRRLGLGVAPEEVPLLWESGIRRTVLTSMPLDGESPPGDGLASLISVPSAETDLLGAGLLVDDYWLISVPGEGSILVHSVSNLWPLIRDTVVKVDWLGRDWSGPGVYGPTRGPDRSGASAIGLSGSFAGVRGRARERWSLDSYSGVTGFNALTGQLLIEIDDETL